MAGSLVAEQSAQPERQAVDQDGFVRLGLGERGGEVAADLDGRPIAGRSARWRAIRSSSSGSPGHAVARNQARPLAGEPARRGQPEPALAAARAAEREDQRAGHDHRPSPTADEGRRPRLTRSSTVSAEDRRVDAAAERARRDERRSRDADRRHPTAIAGTEPTAPAVATTATATTRGRDQRRLTPSRAPTRLGEPRSEPDPPVASPRQRATTTTGIVRADGRRHDQRATGDARAGCRDEHGEVSARPEAKHEDQRDDAARTRSPDPCARPRPGRVRRQQRVGRVGQAVEVEGSGQRRAIAPTARTAASVGLGRARATISDTADGAHHGPDEREGRGAAAPVASRETSSGPAIAASSIADTRPRIVRRPAPQAALTPTGDRQVGRARDRRRTRPGCARRRAPSRAGRRRRSGRRP